MAGTRRRVTSRPRVVAALAVGGVVLLGLAAVGVAGLFRPGAVPAAADRPALWSATHTPSAQSVTEPSRATASPSPSPATSTGRPTPTRRASVGPVPPGAARQFTFVNAVDQTIWLAGWQQTPQPALPVTGWVLPAGQSVSIAVPDKWNGRFWGRTGCSFDASGHGHCQTGDCGGRFQCTGSGATPATLAELTLAAWSGLDFYDVSMVDGSNLPMYINISGGTTKDPISPTGCSSGGCTHPVDCPSAMQVTSGGQVVACKTACAAFGTDDYCCRNSWSGRANCVPAKWPVNYTLVFKHAEPYAYSYAYDDSATMSCRGGCDYRITFGVTH